MANLGLESSLVNFFFPAHEADFLKGRTKIFAIQVIAPTRKKDIDIAIPVVRHNRLFSSATWLTDFARNEVGVRVHAMCASAKCPVASD